MVISMLTSELVRLCTYRTASLKVCAPLYSRLGFYFDAEQNRLACFSCKLSLKLSELKPDCYVLHQKLSPNCRFLNGCDEANVGLKIEPWLNNVEANSVLKRKNSFDSDTHFGPEATNDNSLIQTVYQEAQTRLAEKKRKFPQLFSSQTAVRHETTATDLKETESRINLGVEATIENSSMFTVYRDARMRAEQKGILYDIPTNLAMVYHVEPASTSTGATGFSELPRGTSTSENEISVNNVSISYNRESEASNTASNNRSSSGENHTSPTTAPVRIDRMNPDYDLLRRESVRLSTYYDWPASAKKRPGELAAEGFFYSGLSDRVQCAFCREHLRNWAADDIISIEHSRHFPNCPFVCRRGVNNIRDVPSLSQSDRPSWMSSDGPNSIHNVVSSQSSFTASTNNIGLISTCTTASSTTEESSQQEKKNSGARVEHGSCTLTSGGGGAKGGHQDEPKMSACDADKSALLEENRRLKDARMCKVCLDKEMNTIFLTCGHLTCCEDCAQGMTKCPICRNLIRGTIKTMTL